MENASKAIIIAGSILITVIIVSLLIIVFGKIGDLHEEEAKSLSIEQLEKYNRKFNTFDRSLYGSELLSLANLIDDYNNRILYAENETGTFYEENKFTVYVTLYKDIEAYYNNGDLLYEGLKAKTNAKIDYVKKYNDGLEKRLSQMNKEDPNYKSVKALLTELRSMPFKCDSSRTVYNKSGRISIMYFEQQFDSNIDNAINPK